MPVHDIAPGPLSSSPLNLTRSGDLLYFAANDHSTGFELWAAPLPEVFTDGFESGDVGAWTLVLETP